MDFRFDSATTQSEIYVGTFGSVSVNAQRTPAPAPHTSGASPLRRDIRPSDEPAFRYQDKVELTYEYDRSSARPSNKKLGIIAAVFLLIALSWLISFNKAFAGEKPFSQAAGVRHSAEMAVKSGAFVQADALYQQAFESYAASGYPTQQLADVCAARAQVKERLGDLHAAERLYQQAEAFAAASK